MSDKISANAIQAEAWEGEMGDKWLAHIDRFEGMIAPVGEALVAKAVVRPGDQVIDIGCGGGASSLALAAQVAPGGMVTGLDISPSLIAEAQRRAQARGMRTAQFVVGDASRVHIPGDGFDVLFSRFGIMFFEDPYAAFANMHGFLKPDGRAIFACWAPPSENAWVRDLMAIAAEFVELPKPEPRAPGPFAFADPNYVRDILETAGFRNIRIDPWRGPQMIGGKGATPEEAADFVMDVLFLGEALDDQPDEVKTAARAKAIDLFKTAETVEGVSLPCMVWFVSAEA
jgi:ubiquinone/menaquinone biosynthesis C-methylase UbiE